MPWEDFRKTQLSWALETWYLVASRKPNIRMAMAESPLNLCYSAVLRPWPIQQRATIFIQNGAIHKANRCKKKSAEKEVKRVNSWYSTQRSKWGWVVDEFFDFDFFLKKQNNWHGSYKIRLMKYYISINENLYDKKHIACIIWKIG